MQQSSSMDRDDDVELLGRRRVYTLPTLRFLHVAIVILLIDGIVSVTLWLTGKCGYVTQISSINKVV
jgi:hypothetical protein